jgi:hypothetical protein
MVLQPVKESGGSNGVRPMSVAHMLVETSRCRLDCARALIGLYKAC